MNPADEHTPARLADRAQIQDAIYRYCRGVDRLDFDLVQSTFHDDAVDQHSLYDGDIGGLVAWMRERHVAIAFSMHLVNNILIEFAGPAVAIVESYCLSIQRTRAAPEKSMMTCARYVDRFEQRNGQWRVQHRTAIFDSMMHFDMSASTPRMGEDWTLGRRGGDDPLYALRKQAGLA